MGGTRIPYIPYNAKLLQAARENRSSQTPAEQRIWQELLRQRQSSGYKFLRQKPIDNFIVDFYCSELQLVIEIDGDIHAVSVEYDEARTRALEKYGLHVVRYTNHDVFHNLGGVADDLLRVVAMLKQPPSVPPCQGG